MTAAEMLRELSENPAKMAEFMNALASGMFDEWDCDLPRAFNIFGEQEFCLAAKTGAIIAEAWGEELEP